MPKKATIFVGKMLRRAARIRGGGSALPGLWVEKLEPTFLSETLGRFEHGVILVSGTNGKTTTTKMLAELLTAAGLQVFTNKTGSNFTRGVVSALIEAMDLEGNLPYNTAVLELDEAHAVQFVKQVQPRISLFLNVLRDQLDRFGELDQTARLLGQVAEHTSEAVVLNRDDPLIRGLAAQVKNDVRVHYFGAHENLIHLFPSDDKLRQATPSAKTIKPYTGQTQGDVELAAFKDQKIAFRIGQKLYKTELKVTGYYNFLNAAAALATVRTVLPKTPIDALLRALSKTEPAFGRGEQVTFHKQPVEFVLVKNPSGFRLALTSAASRAPQEATMIAVNDNFADGRDMSWLWDVDFVSLEKGVQMVSGTRAYDMALRLQYDNVPVSVVEQSLSKAFKQFLTKNAGQPMRIYCTYTAMLKLRALAQKELNMERAL
ncbi:MAG TPA: MurT ligase domain-containing protein [Candidatus Saccharimonadales bacterium]